MWTEPITRHVYTLYSITGATRIDRFYVTPNLYEKKVAAETVVAAFTDHHSVILNLDVDASHLRRGKGLWKLHADLIHDPACAATLPREWKRWKHQQRHFPDATLSYRLLTLCRRVGHLIKYPLVPGHLNTLYVQLHNVLLLTF